MSKWTAEGNIISDEEGSQIAEVCCCVIDNNMARQIVREHNAHAELVICLKAMLKITCGECRGQPKEGEKCYADPVECALSAQARAAIEAAEGRE